jgi:hypothetical protein
MRIGCRAAAERSSIGPARCCLCCCATPKLSSRR